MKNISEIKPQTSSFSSMANLLENIYGKAVTLDFDKNCIVKIEVITEKGLLKEIFVTYDKTKITHADNTVAYCPIQPFRRDYNLEAGLKLIQEMKCSE